MKYIILTALCFSFYCSQAQKVDGKLVGTWQLQFSVGKDTCKGQRLILKVYSNKTYHQELENSKTKGKWKTSAGTVAFYNNEGVNYNDSVGDHGHQYEFMKGLLLIKGAPNSEALCPDRYYKRIK